MNFKQTIMESCANVPAMGEAIIAAYECIFEADSTQVQNGGITEDSVAIDPAAITENPEAAKVLANIAEKANQEKEQVEQAQAKLAETLAAPEAGSRRIRGYNGSSSQVP